MFLVIAIYPNMRYNIINEEEDLNEALEDSVKQILLNHRDLEGRTSSIEFQTIYFYMSITIHLDEYVPTRAGNYLGLPKWIKRKRTKTRTTNASHTLVYDKVY